jgi:hypothetical protein
MSHQGIDEEWGCTSTANDKDQFIDGKDDEGILEEENKDEDERDKRNKLNTMPRDGQLQQYNASTPRTRGTRRRKIRDEKERIGPMTSPDPKPPYPSNLSCMSRQSDTCRSLCRN